MPRDAISTTNATSTAGSTDSETMKGADTTKAMTMLLRVRRLGEILITIDGRRLGDHRLGETPITNDARSDARRLGEILITIDGRRRDLEVVAHQYDVCDADRDRVRRRHEPVRAPREDARRSSAPASTSAPATRERLGLRELRQFQLRAQVGVFSVLHAR